VIHRDLKTANILLDDPNDLDSIKIIDFGLCERSLLMKVNEEPHAGTLIYMAPEVASKLEYTKSVDIWALGIIMHLILTGDKHPFYEREKDNSESFKKKLAKLKTCVEPDSSFSWIAKNLFQRLTTIQAHKRYTARDTLKHPWITRNQIDSIPKSFVDEMKTFEYEQILKQKMQILLFLSLIKQ
jgi:calcium/calmodulin-dependent protein kinase I